MKVLSRKKHAEVGLGQDEVDRVEKDSVPHCGNGSLEGLEVPRPARGEGASGCAAFVLRCSSVGFYGEEGASIVESYKHRRS